MLPDIRPVSPDCAILLREQVLALPDIEPLGKRQARRLYVKSVVDRFLRVAHGGQHFFLRVAVDAAADRLSCAGVIADGHAGFPSTVRPLPDASSTRCGARIRFPRHELHPLLLFAILEEVSRVISCQLRGKTFLAMTLQWQVLNTLEHHSC